MSRRRTMGVLAAGVLACVVFVAPAAGDEITLSASARSAMGLTFYEGGLTMVRDSRRVTVPAGSSRLVVEQVSEQLQPETLLLAGKNLRVTARRFEFDLISSASLLQRSLGGTVRVIRENPATGSETTERAEVLSVNGEIILRMGDRIETGVPGRLVFDSIPPGLRPRPAVVAEVTATSAGARQLDISYLTGGLAWNADYVGRLSGDGRSLDLTCFATLTNNGSVGFDQARVHLVVGRVEQPRPTPQPRAMAAAVQARAMSMDAMVEAPLVEATGDLHLYTLDRPVDLGPRQRLQVPLFHASGIPLDKEYRLTHVVPGHAQRTNGGEPPRRHPRLRLSFVNQSDLGPGLPLPPGGLRLYGEDGHGVTHYQGGVDVAATPRGERVNFEPSQAFDLSVRHRQIRHEVVGNDHRAFITGWQVTLSNARSEAETVVLHEVFPGSWQILDTSHPHTTGDANTAAWRIKIPAQGSVELSFTAQVNRP